MVTGEKRNHTLNLRTSSRDKEYQFSATRGSKCLDLAKAMKKFLRLLPVKNGSMNGILTLYLLPRPHLLPLTLLHSRLLTFSLSPSHPSHPSHPPATLKIILATRVNLSSSRLTSGNESSMAFCRLFPNSLMICFTF